MPFMPGYNAEYSDNDDSDLEDSLQCGCPTCTHPDIEARYDELCQQVDSIVSSIRYGTIKHKKRADPVQSCEQSLRKPIPHNTLLRALF